MHAGRRAVLGMARPRGQSVGWQPQAGKTAARAHIPALRTDCICVWAAAMSLQAAARAPAQSVLPRAPGAGAFPCSALGEHARLLAAFVGLPEASAWGLIARVSPPAAACRRLLCVGQGCALQPASLGDSAHPTHRSVETCKLRKLRSPDPSFAPPCTPAGGRAARGAWCPAHGRRAAAVRAHSSLSGHSSLGTWQRIELARRSAPYSASQPSKQACMHMHFEFNTAQHLRNARWARLAASLPCTLNALACARWQPLAC